MDRGRTRTVEREDGERSRRGGDAGSSGLLRVPSPTVVTARGMALAFALALAGVVVGGMVPLVGAVGRFVGLFLAAFALGLAGSRRRYVESGIAGALAAGLGALLGTLATPFFPAVARYGVAIAGVGAGLGLVVSVAGHYFGRDLRAGLTRDL
ncbi:MAG: hypothetical protein ABEJ81_05860 [Haloferacaceae archaeon]